MNQKQKENMVKLVKKAAKKNIVTKKGKAVKPVKKVAKAAKAKKVAKK